MKKHLLIGLFAIIVQACSPASEATVQRVGELSKKKFQWMIKQQLDSLTDVLDDRLKYIHSNGWIQTKEDVIADLKSNKVIYQSIEVSDTETRVYENTAIVTGKGKFSGINNKIPFASELMFTEVYVLKDKNWKLASRHANKMQ